MEQSAITRVLLVTTGDAFVDPALLAALRAHGCEVEAVEHPHLASSLSVPDLRRCDLVLCQGAPHGSRILAVAEWLTALPSAESRPLFVWWLTENLPGGTFPAWLVTWGARLRVALDRQLRRHGLVARLLRLPVLDNLNQRGHYLRILGELYALRRDRLPDLLPVGGEAKARYLQRLGFPAFPLFLGYYPSFGSPLGLERDVDVVFVGGLGMPRRRKIVEQVEAELSKRGIRLTVHSGVDGWLAGEERNRLLNRTKIVLNIPRARHHGNSYRLLMGAGTKSLVVSEPLQNRSGFVPGRHFVEVPIDRLSDCVAYYLRHEDERRAICEAAYLHATAELTIERAVGELLARCRDVARHRQRAVSGA